MRINIKKGVALFTTVTMLTTCFLTNLGSERTFVEAANVTPRVMTTETFDDAVVTSDGSAITTSVFPVGWQSSFSAQLVEDDDYDGDKALKLTFLNDDVRLIEFRVPKVMKGVAYRASYTIKQANAGIANQSHLNVTDSEQLHGTVYVDYYEKQNISTFVSNVDCVSSDASSVTVSIWFWGNAIGDSIIIDDLKFEEITKIASGDYNADGLRNSLQDLIRVKKHMAGVGKAVEAAETTGDYSIDVNDQKVMMSAMVGSRVVSQKHIQNVNGNFDNGTGIVSLYAGKDTADVYGSGWSNEVIFNEIPMETDSKIHVTSMGESLYESLVIQIDSPIKKEQKYRITMKMHAIDEQQKNVEWTYYVGDEVGHYGSEDTSHVIQGPITNAGNMLFDESGAAIEFVSNQDSECARLVIFDNGSDNHFNFTIDDIYMESLGYEVTHSLLNDDGSFEGKKGNVSLYSSTEFPQDKLNSDAAWQNNSGAEKTSFQKKVQENGNTVVHVTSNGTRWEMVYFKFTEKLSAGVEYQLYYETNWCGSGNRPSGLGYAILPDIGNWIVGETDNVVNFIDIAWQDGENRITFTPNANVQEWYFVLVDRTEGVSLDFLLDNMQLSSTAVENDDGTFEGNTGNVSLYSSTELDQSKLNSGVAWQNNGGSDKITFQKVMNDDNNCALRITSNSSLEDRWDLVYIKFTENLVAGKEYRISYKADWNEAVPIPTGGYGILSDVGQWVADTTISSVGFDQSKMWWDGKVNLTFTSNVDVSEWYLVLVNQTGTTEFDFTIDDISVERKDCNLLGLCEANSEVNPEVENTLTKGYVSTVAGTLGVKNYRLWMHFSKMLVRDANSNGVTVNESAAKEMHEFIALLKAQGVERFIGMTSNYLHPYGYIPTTNSVVPNPTTEAVQYYEFLKLFRESFRVLAEEFPEIDFFEPGNEPDLKTGQNLCKNGYDWTQKDSADANADYLWTTEENVWIVADMMWYAKAGVESVNKKNQIVMPALCGYNETPEYLTELYNVIESGNLPTGADIKHTNPDEYFDILNWHPYLLGSEGVSNMDESWVKLQSDIFAVAQDHDDGEKEVWYTEMGFTDQSVDTIKEINATNITKMLNYIQTDLSFVKTVFLYRVSNLTEDFSINKYEDNFGMFYSLNDSTENKGKPKQVAQALYRWYYGQNVDLAPLYELANYKEE